MNIRELEYLIAVDEERHFHRAAERCFVSQPTLSGQLKKRARGPERSAASLRGEPPAHS